MKRFILLWIIILFISCGKSNGLESIVDIQNVAENIIYSIIDKERIYDIMIGFAYYGNIKNITLLDVQILFNPGFWQDTENFNEDIEKKILEKLYEAFSNEGEKHLKREDIKIRTHYRFRINFPTEITFSKKEKENIRKLLWDNFELTFILEFYDKYCEGWLDSTLDFNEFVVFMKYIFGNDINIEL